MPVLDLFVRSVAQQNYTSWINEQIPQTHTLHEGWKLWGKRLQTMSHEGTLASDVPDSKWQQVGRAELVSQICSAHLELMGDAWASLVSPASHVRMW